MADKYEIVGETWSPDAKERRLRVFAQLVDKPLFLVIVALAFAVAARGPGAVIPGYQPSGWFVFGLWVAMCVAARLLILAFLARFRAVKNIPAPRRAGDTPAARRASDKVE